MTRFEWDQDKNEQLQRERGISFEEIVAAIASGGLLANRPHPSQGRYPHQRVLIVAISDYAWVVPCFVKNDGYHLVTAFASRKATRDYLRRTP